MLKCRGPAKWCLCKGLLFPVQEGRRGLRKARSVAVHYVYESVLRTVRQQDRRSHLQEACLPRVPHRNAGCQPSGSNGLLLEAVLTMGKEERRDSGNSLPHSFTWKSRKNRRLGRRRRTGSSPSHTWNHPRPGRGPRRLSPAVPRCARGESFSAEPPSRLPGWETC